jgi:hypothetical protein
MHGGVRIDILGQPPMQNGGAMKAPGRSPLVLLNGGDTFGVGDRVLLDQFYGAVVRHFGPVDFAPGIWAGLVLDEDVGKNDGVVMGKRYFDCAPKHGLFTLQSRLTRQAEVRGCG